MMLLYSHNQVKKVLEPMIKEKIGIKLQARHAISTELIIKELIPLNKEKLPWEKVFEIHYPYYYIYGVNKRNYKMMESQMIPKLEALVRKVIHCNIPINLLPLESNNMPKDFDNLPLENYILYYCLLAFSGNWSWLMGEMDLIYGKVPGIEKLPWEDYYTKYSQVFRKVWAKHIDL